MFRLFGPDTESNAHTRVSFINMISYNILTAVEAASNYFGSLSGSSVVPPTTEQIELVHQQLRKWQTEDPPTLRSKLVNYDTCFINGADQTEKCAIQAYCD